MEGVYPEEEDVPSERQPLSAERHWLQVQFGTGLIPRHGYSLTLNFTIYPGSPGHKER